MAQRFNPGHDKVVQDFDMLYNTEQRDTFRVVPSARDYRRRRAHLLQDGDPDHEPDGLL